MYDQRYEYVRKIYTDVNNLCIYSHNTFIYMNVCAMHWYFYLLQCLYNNKMYAVVTYYLFMFKILTIFQFFWNWISRLYSIQKANG